LNIAYYVSAHGYGHAAREQAVIQALTARGARVFVRSAAPAKFFTAAVHQHPIRYDIGMIQLGPMQVEPAATARAYADLLNHQPTLIQHELAFLHAEQIDLIAADMPPIACEIAAAAGLPCVVLTHFTWDWIYTHYLSRFPEFAPIIESITDSYGKATLALQMQIPIPHPFTMFPHVEPIPGVAKTPTRTREQIRADFHVPDGMKMAVLSMGGHDWGKTDVRALQRLEGWRFLVMPGAYAQVEDDDRFRLIPQEYPDFHNLIAASDVLIGKAGGSTVAEIIAHRTPMIYTVNEDWRENELMMATLDRYAHSLYLDKPDFEQGAWAEHLDTFVDQPYIWPDVPMNGAEVAAERLMQMGS
jgi:hypothetical protein